MSEGEGWAPREGVTPEGAVGGSATPESAGGAVRMTAWVRGRVQGVGFRWFTRARALGVGGLNGFVSNLEDGRVQVVAEGQRRDCDALLDWLRTGDTPGRVDGVTEIWSAPRGGYPPFEIR
ncbi:acylphosphatase [Streptomyces sp. P38-E01]|uniref:acylphosphatase n=2 Tax=Streptomyces tardus TaxID=2780544 RepID=A0A949JH39_9ACTN|nr:acylphosphatase [Streptomyces tardus]